MFVWRFRFEFDLTIEFRCKSFICVGLSRDRKDFRQRFMDTTPNMLAGGDVLHSLAACKPYILQNLHQGQSVIRVM